MSKSIRRAVVLLLSLVVFTSLTAASCASTEGEKRAEQAQQAAKRPDSLEKTNLLKKQAMENDPSRVGYITLLAGVSGKPFGYYAVKGKVSNSGSQVDPEDLIECRSACSYGPVSIDGPQDDGTYGEGDPGVFFFTTDGTYVETTSDYVYTSQPLPSALKIPKLG